MDFSVSSVLCGESSGGSHALVIAHSYEARLVAVAEIIDNILNALSTTLTLVATADADQSLTLPATKTRLCDSAHARLRNHTGMGAAGSPGICVILNGLGVSAAKLDKMEELVSAESMRIS